MNHTLLPAPPTLFLAIIVISGFVAGPAAAQSVVGFGATGFSESSQLETTEFDGIESTDETFDYGNANFLSGRLHYLRPFDDELRVGLGLDFQGVYRGELADVDELNDLAEPYEFGPLIETMAIAEWRISIADRLDFGLGGHIGLATLFPTGDLAEEISGLQDEGVNVWQLPRFGWGLGAHMLAVWELTTRFALRADIGVQWQTISLFRIDESFGESVFQRRWTTSTLRSRIGLSIELRL